MNISANGLALITAFERFFPEPYDDPAGHATIGYGHLIHLGRVTKADREQWGRLTEQQALDLLAKDLIQYQQAVLTIVTVPLNQNQLDALISFTYNVGQGALRKSTLCQRLNSGDYPAVPAELRKYNKAGGKVLPGLSRRRDAEAALFLQPVDENEEPTMFGFTDPKNECKVLCNANGAVFTFGPDGSGRGGHYLGGLDKHPEWQAGVGKPCGPAVAIHPWNDGNPRLSGYVIITLDVAGVFHNYNFPSDGSLAEPTHRELQETGSQSIPVDAP